MMAFFRHPLFIYFLQKSNKLLRFNTLQKKIFIRKNILRDNLFSVVQQVTPTHTVSHFIKAQAQLHILPYPQKNLLTYIL